MTNPVAPKTDMPARPCKMVAVHGCGEEYLVRDVEDYIERVESTLAAERASRLQAEEALQRGRSLTAFQIGNLNALKHDRNLSVHGEGSLAAYTRIHEALSKPSVSPEHIGEQK
jgi:hypothetical protein